MILRVITVTLLGYILMNCSGSDLKAPPMTGGKTISVNLNEARPYKFSDIYDSVRYVRLETNWNHLLGEIRKVRRYGDRLYIQCNNGVFTFDKDGKFLTAIGSKGQGYGKFTVITDFLVDTVTNRIEIMDRRSQKVMYYTPSGILVEEWNFGLNAEAFHKASNNLYVFYTANYINIKNKQRSPYRLIVQDRDNDIQSEFLRIDDHKAEFMLYSDIVNFQPYHDSLIFMQSGIDTVYNIGRGRISPRYIFDFGSDNIPEEFMEENYKDVSYFNVAVEKKNYAGLFNTFMRENKNLIFTIVKKGTRRLIVVHDKQKKRNIIANELFEDLVFDGNEVIEWKSTPRGQSDNELYYVIESSRIVDMYDSLKTRNPDDAYLQAHPQLVSLASNMKLSDNPVLRICYLKSELK